MWLRTLEGRREGGKEGGTEGGKKEQGVKRGSREGQSHQSLWSVYTCCYGVTLSALGLPHICRGGVLEMVWGVSGEVQ